MHLELHLGEDLLAAVDFLEVVLLLEEGVGQDNRYVHGHAAIRVGGPASVIRIFLLFSNVLS